MIKGIVSFAVFAVIIWAFWMSWEWLRNASRKRKNK